MVKNVKKEYIQIAMKIWLNEGKKTTKSLLDEHELKMIPKLEEMNIIEPVYSTYHDINPVWKHIFENAVDTAYYMVNWSR